MEERVKYLFRKYLDDTCTKEEFEEVFFYLQKKENEPFIRELLREWHVGELPLLPSGIFIDGSGELKGIPPSPAETKTPNSTRTRKATVVSLAVAGILVLATLAVWRGIPHQGTPALARTKGKLLKQVTRSSEYKYLLLPDSTQVWLNAGSTLEIAESFGKNDRTVVLTGEAFFDVTHSEKLPFVIYTGRVSTEVLGTAFNIKAYPDLEKIVVTVKKGKVKVNLADKQVALLTMGQQVSIGNNDDQIKEKKAKVEDATSWQHGDLVYDDYTIEDIVSDLERVYSVKILFDHSAVGNMRISTAFKKRDGVVKALEVLSELTDTKFSTH